MGKNTPIEKEASNKEKIAMLKILEDFGKKELSENIKTTILVSLPENIKDY